MVTFQLVSQTKDEIKYNYFPEGDETCKTGVIAIDIRKEEIRVLHPAEKDFLVTVTVDSMKAVWDSINEMRAEQGETPLTEEELPVTTEENSYYCYAEKAIREIVKGYDAGNVLKSGCLMWY